MKTRTSLRLPHYDYTQAGAYFVTICTTKRETFLAEIISEESQLTPIGQIVHEEWFKSAVIRREIALFEDED